MDTLLKSNYKRIISIILILSIFINLVVPLKSFGAYTESGQVKYNVLRVSPIEKKSSGKYGFYVEYAAIGDSYVGSFDVSLKYDTNLFGTARKTTGAANNTVANVSDTNSDYWTFQVKETKDGNIRMMATTTDWYNPDEDGDEGDLGVGEISAFKVYFYIKDESKFKLDGSDEITSDMISFNPTASLQYGYTQRVAQDADGTSPTWYSSLDYVTYGGFVSADKNITGITVKTNPTKLTYEWGETADLTDGEIEVTYDDTSTETVSMSDPYISVTSGTPVGTVTDTPITIDYKGFSANIPVTVNDPYVSLTISSPMATTEYDTGVNLDFTGLGLIATKKSGATESLQHNSTGVTISENVADVNSSNFTAFPDDGSGITKGTQKITFTYEGQTADATVTVNDKIDSIELTSQPTKTAYKYGESLNLSGAVVKVNFASGNSRNINLPDGNVGISTFSNTTTGSKQNLTVTYAGKTATNKINVEVYDYITGVTFTAPTKDAYKVGDSTLSVTGGKFKFDWASGTTPTTVNLTTAMVSGFDTTTAGTKTLTATYDPKYTLSDGTIINDVKTGTFNIDVEKIVDSIEIVAPSKTVYKHGESLNFVGGKVEVKYTDGTSDLVTMSTSMVKESDGTSVNMIPASYDSTNKIDKTLTISFAYDGKSKTVNYPITIINDVKSIAIHAMPKTVYNVNESLDISTGEIEVTRAIGTPEIINMTDSRVQVTGFDSTIEHTNLPLTVKFEENGISQTNTYNVNVKDTVTAITMKTTPKTNYKYSEALDVTGGQIEVIKGSGTSTVNLDASMITEMDGTAFDSTTLGTRNLKVTYGGQTTTYEVTIKDYVTGIKLNPDTVTGNVNDTLSQIITDNSITYTVTYAKAGDQTAVALDPSMVSGYSATTVTQQSLTVKYTDTDTNSATNGTDFTGTLKVTLADAVDSIEVTAPTKIIYNHGDSLDLTTGTINVKTVGGATIPVTMTDAMVTESGLAVNMSPASYDSTNKVTKTLTITYTDGGKTGTASYPITIVNDVKSIAIHTTPKDEYNVNDTLDISTGEIEVTRAVGTPEIIAMTDSRVEVTGFDSDIEYTNLPITVTFKENDISKSNTYNINVKDTVTAIAMKTTPKTNYKYAETLDVAGGQIEVTKGSGTSTVNLTLGMVTEMDGTAFDPTILGTRNLKVTYGGQTTTYEVTVKDYVTGITVSPNTVTGNINDTLSQVITDNSITYTVTYAKAGVQTPVTLDTSMVAGYSSTILTSQTLFVKYTDTDTNSATNGTDFTDNLNVTLNDVVDTIVITAPTKTTYNHGDSLDLSTGNIVVTTVSGASKNVNITDAMVTESGSSVNMSPASYDSTNKVAKTLTITYTEGGKTETASYPITIVNDVKSIAIHTTPKDEYNVNDTLDISTGEIEVTRAVGIPEVIAMTDSRVTVIGFDSTSEHTGLPITVKFEENGISQTNTYNVNVKDTVTAITMKTTPKTNYKYNEALDVTGGQIEVTKGSGTATVNIDPSMVTEMDGTAFDPTLLGTRDLKVTYGGETTTYEVTVKDYVTGITVNPTAVTGNYGDTLSSLLSANTVTYTITYAKAGAQTPVVVTDGMVLGYSSNVITDQTLTVKYTDTDTNSATKGTDFTGTFKVTLADDVDTIIINVPTKATYNHGDSLDLTTGNIVVTTTSGVSKNVNITSAMVTEGGSSVNMSPTSYDSTNKVAKTLTITYTEGGKTETASYPITIVNDIKSIAIQTTPKDEYNVSDTLDISTGEIEVTRAVGTPEIIAMTDSRVTVTGFDSSSEYTGLPITVKFEENGISKTNTYNVNIKDTVTAITMKTTPKTNYKYNEALDVTGGELEVTKGSGTTTVNLDASMVTEIDGTPFDSTLLGTRNLKVTYGGQTTTYEVTVKDYVTGITVSPNSLAGVYGDLLSSLLTTNTVTYTVTYAKAGAQTPVVVTDSIVTGYSATDTTKQTLPVSYVDNDNDSATKGTTFTDDLEITLQDNISNAVLENTPKTNYKYGEELDVTGGTIKVTRVSGDVSIPITKDMVTEEDGSPFDSTKLGTRNLKITYSGEEMTYQITVSDYVSGIVLTPPTKVKYEYGESLDLTGGTVQKVMASGAATSAVPLTDSSVTLSTFNPNKEGAQTINVTYEGETQSFGVIVEDNVQSIVISSTPKTDYKYGEALNVSGGTIIATKTSGKAETINLNNSMVSGYDPEQLGNQTLTITYKGKKATYTIGVEDYVDSISIVKPNKLVYKLDESLDLTGGKVSVIMASGIVDETVQMTAATISGFNSSSEGAKLIKVTYRGKSETFGITVVDELSDVILKTLPNKLDYKYGESLDLTGGTLEVVKESGATKTVKITKDMVSGYNSKKLGQQKLKVEYEGFKSEFYVNVEDYVSKLTITKPTKTEYEYGESLDLTGGKVSVIMASGKVDETVQMTAAMVSGFDSNKVGTQTIKVDYKDLQGNFQVKVVDSVKGISINTEPDKTEYEYGEKLDLTGGTITVIKSSGITNIPITKKMVSGFDSKKSGTQVVTVTYGGFTTKFIVNVNPKTEETKPEEETKEETKPQKTVKQNSKPATRTVVRTVIVEKVQEETPTETPVDEPLQEVPIDEPLQEPVKEEITETTPAPKEEEKPTQTLGVKDDKSVDSEGKDKLIAGIIGGIGLLLLLLLLFLRRNVKIYVEEDGEFALAGIDKVNSKNPELDIDKYLDKETYPNRVKVHLNDSISEKLDGKELEITHRGEKIKHKVKYNDEPYEFILEASEEKQEKIKASQK